MRKRHLSAQMNPTSPSPARTLIRTLLWQRVDQPGLEYCQLWDSGDGFALTGTVISALPDHDPMQVDYEVICSRTWETRTVRVTLTQGATTRELDLRVDQHRRWWRGDEELPALAGCIDVDLSATPSTNTLPIRRLALAVGDGRDVTAAWVRLPELTVEPLPQRYVRTGDRQYRYESRGGAFTAMLDIDDLGLVVDYPPAWGRVGGRS